MTKLSKITFKTMAWGLWKKNFNGIKKGGAS